MAKINAPTFQQRVYQGATGNLSCEHGYANVSAADGDVINVLEMPAGLKIIGVRVATDGLGAGVKGKIKIGDHVLAASVDLSAAKSQIIAVKPVMLESQKEALTVELTGAAAAGEIHVLPEYLSVGTY